MKATALAPAMALKAGGRGITDGRGRFGVRRALVVAQVALSLVLLIGALLFTRTLYNLLTIDAGFDQNVDSPESLASQPDARPIAAARTAQRIELLERLAAIPGVAGAAIADNMLLTGGFWNEFVFAERQRRKRRLSNFMTVGANFFELLGVPVLKGRPFSSADVAHVAARGDRQRDVRATSS